MFRGHRSIVRSSWNTAFAMLFRLNFFKGYFKCFCTNLMFFFEYKVLYAMAIFRIKVPKTPTREALLDSFFHMRFPCIVIGDCLKSGWPEQYNVQQAGALPKSVVLFVGLAKPPVSPKTASPRRLDSIHAGCTRSFSMHMFFVLVVTKNGSYM